MRRTTDNDRLSMDSLRNHFLIAMPSLSGSIFSHTITYICDHTEEGAMGLVINQSLNITLDEIFQQMGVKSKVGATPVLSGGPVQPERGFVLHSADSRWDSTLEVADDILLTASRDVINAIAEGHGPEHYLVILGYAGWAAGQLEDELADNSWLTAPADSNILFHTPIEQRWNSVASNLGIDLDLISSTAGHA